MAERETAGQLSLKAAADSTRYDPLEVGEALCDGILSNLVECAQQHEAIIDEPVFCIAFVIVEDPLLKNIKRRKFYAWPFLPKPRPNQSVFLYRKADQSLTRLWVLPPAHSMAILSESTFVNPEWRSMKRWSESFFKGTFWEDIRKEHGIDLLSEEESVCILRSEEELLLRSQKEKIEPIDQGVNVLSADSRDGNDPIDSYISEAQDSAFYERSGDLRGQAKLPDTRVEKGLSPLSCVSLKKQTKQKGVTLGKH